jgi:prevent-host-death family protein
MRTVGSRELKNRLGRYLGLVGKGETIVVTDRGKPVARLSPPEPESSKVYSVDDLLRDMEAAGHLRRPTGNRKDRVFKPVVTRGKSASQMVLEDRE